MVFLEVNNGFGELPKKRGFKATIVSCFIAITIYFVAVLSYRKHYNIEPLSSLNDLGDCCVVITGIMLGELFRSLVIFGEEWKHCRSRYSNSICRTFIACLPWSPKLGCILKAIIFSICFMGCIMYWTISINPFFTFYHFTVIALFNSLNYISLSKAEISHLNETENKHVADGLAWSYYFGYLKLMLPSVDRMISLAVMDDYGIDDCDLRDKLSSKKIFIVIPRNCYTYDSFTEVDNRITFASSMPPQRRTRGGVQERVYKNTVWKIQVTESEDPLYVMMEYATPCLAMYDMKQNAQALFSQEDLEAQVKEFSMKLQDILSSDAECQNKFQIVLCGDVKEQKLGDVIAKQIYDTSN